MITLDAQTLMDLESQFPGRVIRGAAAAGRHARGRPCHFACSRANFNSPGGIRRTGTPRSTTRGRSAWAARSACMAGGLVPALRAAGVTRIPRRWTNCGSPTVRRSVLLKYRDEFRRRLVESQFRFRPGRALLRLADPAGLRMGEPGQRPDRSLLAVRRLPAERPGPVAAVEKLPLRPARTVAHQRSFRRPIPEIRQRSLGRRRAALRRLARPHLLAVADRHVLIARITGGRTPGRIEGPARTGARESGRSPGRTAAVPLSARRIPPCTWRPAGHSAPQPPADRESATYPAVRCIHDDCRPYVHVSRRAI